VLCIKVHFVHFYPSNECCVKRHSFFSQLVCVYCVCVCVLFFSHTPKAKTQNLFFLLGVGEDIICKRHRWWVYWVLIIYTLLLPWQFSTLIYIYFKNVENFNVLVFFPQVTKKFWKKILNIQEILFGRNDFSNYLFIYLTNIFWSLLPRYVLFLKKLINYLTNIGSTCQGITIYDIGFNRPQKQFGGHPRKNLPIQNSFFKKWG